FSDQFFILRLISDTNACDITVRSKPEIKGSFGVVGVLDEPAIIAQRNSVSSDGSALQKASKPASRRMLAISESGDIPRAITCLCIPMYSNTFPVKTPFREAAGSSSNRQ